MDSSPVFQPIHLHADNRVEIRAKFDRATVDDVCSDDPAAQLKATTQFLLLLSTERNPPIEEVVQSGLVPRFVKFLSGDDFPELQLAAASVLCKISSGTIENTREIVSHGAVPTFVNLLGSADVRILEMAVLALGNIAFDSPKYCDLVHSSGALSPLLSLLNNRGCSGMSEGWGSVIEQATWTLSIFCTYLRYDQTRPALPVLKKLLLSKDERILENACCAFCFLSSGIDWIDQIQAILDAGICPMLVQLLRHSSKSVVIPTLCTVANIAAGGDTQIKTLIDHNVLRCLAALLGPKQDESVKKDACCAIANIADGTEEQIEAVIRAGLIHCLVRVFRSRNFAIREQVLRAISNAIRRGSHEQICLMARQGVIDALCIMLNYLDRKLCQVTLEGLEKLLVAGESDKAQVGVNKYAEMIAAKGGKEKIAVIKREMMVSCRTLKLGEKAGELLETYWK